MNLLFADSNNRDSTLYPEGNYYVLFLTRAFRNVKRVELVSARVPNTMYNLTDGSNVLTYNATSNVSLNPGFYSTYTLAQALTNAGYATVDYLANEGHFIFSNVSNFSNITINSTELGTMLGMVTGQILPSGSAGPTYPTYSGKQIIVSSTLVDMSLNDYIFLDIDEFKTPYHVDTGSMNTTTGTIATPTVNRAFAPVIMDVGSACIKNFHENKDYKVSVEYPEPINSLDRLTVRWVDRQGNLLNFQGWNTNAFILRIYLAEPVQEIQEAQEQRVVLRNPSPVMPPPRQPKFQWWFIVLAMAVTFVIWKSVKKTVL